MPIICLIALIKGGNNELLFNSLHKACCTGLFPTADFCILRVCGNLFGTKQSGEMTFKIANITRDIKILKQASIDSQEFIKQNIKII